MNFTRLCALLIVACCLILILKTLQYFGLRIVHTDGGAERVLGGESRGQLPLKDALLWTAATADGGTDSNACATFSKHIRTSPRC